MEKNKLSNIGIIVFVCFIAIFAIFSGYVFFNNSSNLAIKITSNDEQLKRDAVINEALTKTLIQKNDTIGTLGKVINLKTNEKLKDSLIIIEKDTQIKKLAHEKDSLTSLILKYRWSDIEPVHTKSTK